MNNITNTTISFELDKRITPNTTNGFVAIESNTTNNFIAMKSNTTNGFMDIELNTTSDLSGHRSNFEFFVYLIVNFLLSLGNLGTVCLIWILVVSKRFHIPHNYLIFSLGFTNLLLTGYVLPFHISNIIQDGKTASRILCIFNGATACIAMSSIVFSVLFLALERYVVICRSNSINGSLQGKTILMMCVLTWLIPFAVVSFSVILEQDLFIYDMTLHMCMLDIQSFGSFCALYSFTMLLLPLSVSIVFYIKIYTFTDIQPRVIVQSSRFQDSLAQLATSRHQNKLENVKLCFRFFLTTMTSVVLFVFSSILRFRMHSDITDILHRLGLMGLFANSAFYYVIYRKNNSIRGALKDKMPCAKKRRGVRVTPVHTLNTKL